MVTRRLALVAAWVCVVASKRRGQRLGGGASSSAPPSGGAKHDGPLYDNRTAVSFLAGGKYPLPPPSIGNGSAAAFAARSVAAKNRARLAAIVARLEGGDEARLCRGPFPAKREGAALQWLHVPKCGSTFATTFVKYGCDQVAKRRDVYLGAAPPVDLERPDGRTMGTTGLARMAGALCEGKEHRFGLIHNDGIEGSVAHFANHFPLQGEGKDARVAVVLRSPNQRLLSAYHFGKHLWGSEMKNRQNTIGGRHYLRWRTFLQDTVRSPRDFAATPGVHGCYAKMLNGCYCATRPREVAPRDRRTYSGASTEVACPWGWRTLDTALAVASADRLANFAFVGLQEVYNASVCLFHALHGGNLDPAEFGLFNVGYAQRGKHHRISPERQKALMKEKYGLSSQKRKSDWDEAPLGDFVDAIDEYVWAAALDKFEADLDAALAGPAGGVRPNADGAPASGSKASRKRRGGRQRP